MQNKSPRETAALIYGQSFRADVFMQLIPYTVTAERIPYNKRRP